MPMLPLEHRLGSLIPVRQSRLEHLVPLCRELRTVTQHVCFDRFRKSVGFEATTTAESFGNATDDLGGPLLTSEGGPRAELFTSLPPPGASRGGRSTATCL